MLRVPLCARGTLPVRCLAFAIVAVGLSSCQSAPQAALEPLAEEGTPLSYYDLSFRTKDQVFAAQEFFFTDDWENVQKAARALQDSAARLKNMDPDDVPDPIRGRLAAHAEELTKAAEDLHAAANAQDVRSTNAVFQRLNLKVRDLRAEE